MKLQSSGLVCCCIVWLLPATGFLLDRTARSFRVQEKADGCLYSKRVEVFDEKEVKEMEDMIISLSLEATDESRRQRLESIFAVELAKPNGMPRHFSNLFDYTLVIVGDRVKLEAQEHALKLQREQMQMESIELNFKKTEEFEQGNDTEESPTSEPFPEQRQLWALVDMMVQSKTIVKRASGELGSKGTFQ